MVDTPDGNRYIAASQPALFTRVRKIILADTFLHLEDGPSSY
jgi:hypothetical protein